PASEREPAPVKAKPHTRPRPEPAPKPVRREAEPKVSIDPARPGYLSIDTLPYSQIYIDGKLAGITPLVRVPLKAGKHSVRAVPQSGAEKKLTITVGA